jgi:hypothetical protein
MMSRSRLTVLRLVSKINGILSLRAHGHSRPRRTVGADDVPLNLPIAGVMLGNDALISKSVPWNQQFASALDQWWKDYKEDMSNDG